MMSETGADGCDGTFGFDIPPPRTSSELITVLAHYHRAEIARMAGWRDRLDRTTNWAITVVAAMLSVALSTASAHHGVLLFAMLLTSLLLTIEARRYRFFDVYRNRVRLLERHYYAQLFAPSEDSSRSWTSKLGLDLRQPRFKVRFIDAVGRRMRRNYIWMFLILLLAWFLKICPAELTHVGSSGSFTDSAAAIAANAAVGVLPGTAVLTCVGAFHLCMLAMALRSLLVDARGLDVQVHV